MMAGGRSPDIFYVAPVTLGSMLSKGVLLNLEPYLEKSQLVGVEDFFSANSRAVPLGRQALWPRADLRTVQRLVA